MGAVKRVFNKVTRLGGYITGSTQQAKAAEQQAKEMEKQNRYEAEQAANAAKLTQASALAAQSQVEGTMARDKAIAEAESERQKAALANNTSADVELAPDAGGEVDSQGRRVNIRERFMSNRGSSSGINM